ncbi:MAG: hypothetical protein ACXADY_17595 [Candidatus Hodarchaeales archaeon]
MSSDHIHNDCLFLLKSNDGSITYCLKFRLWSEPCPPRCDQFISGEPGSIDETQSRNYDIECRDFTREKSSQALIAYYCKLHMQTKPFCHSCIFHRYQTDPFDPK